MSATSKVPKVNSNDLRLSAAIPLHLPGPLDAQARATTPLSLKDHMRMVKETDFENFNDGETTSELDKELDSILERKFDEAAVPEYQFISRIDREQPKMKKHQR